MDPNQSILVINLVCRNSELKKSYITIVQQLFPFILLCDVPNEVNTLLFCFIKVPDANFKNISTHVAESIKLIRCSSVVKKSLNRQSENNKQKPQKKGTLRQQATDNHFDGVFDDIDAISNSFKVLKV